MGCGGSTQEGKKKTKDADTRKGSLFFRRPKVDMAVGEAVKLEDGYPQVIFVFGGPGSRKGRLLDDLSKVYHFEQLNLDRIVSDAIFKKVEEPDMQRRTDQIQEYIKTQPETLRLDWMLKQVTQKLDELPKTKCYLVDFMPNQKVFLNALMNLPDCDNELKVFENKYRVSFAIDFTVSNEKRRVAPQCAVPKSQKKDGEKSQSDEADSIKLQRRAMLYNKCVRIFLDYFKKKKNLVTLDVTAHAHDDVWEKVCEFFSDLEFLHFKNVDTVLFFVFGDNDMEKYRVNMFDAIRVNVKDMAVDLSALPEKIIPALCQFVDDCYPTKKRFIINLDESSITKDCMRKDPRKVVQFQDIEACELENYIRRCTSKFKVPAVKLLCSSENEVCLFPIDTPRPLCKYIAGLFRAYQEMQMRKMAESVDLRH